MAEVVHIKVEGVLDELILHSMQVLNQTFFNSSTINQAESFDLIFEFKEEICEDHLIVTATLGEDTQVIKRQLEVNESKTRKYAYLAAYLLLLQRETGRVQSWGLLNGMRPTKLVHGMKKRGYTDEEIKAYMQNDMPEKFIPLLPQFLQYHEPEHPALQSQYCFSVRNPIMLHE